MKIEFFINKFYKNIISNLTHQIVRYAAYKYMDVLGDGTNKRNKQNAKGQIIQTLETWRAFQVVFT